ncbi:hypothetical protein BDV95DRAFT_596809 [Massariosphaeria phaeospora]|uniref:Uncharacterized protein n=1 Tax=Massariosphaeria phaeospora TaxID=100035 RepID=A0A7C8IAD8_9PLEO|nr:hypothetical protein BDV95DRAFT_596809 [Massariosphaeria phaeospora]
MFTDQKSLILSAGVEEQEQLVPALIRKYSRAHGGASFDSCPDGLMLRRVLRAQVIRSCRSLAFRYLTRPLSSGTIQTTNSTCPGVWTPLACVYYALSARQTEPKRSDPKRSASLSWALLVIVQCFVPVSAGRAWTLFVSRCLVPTAGVMLNVIQSRDAPLAKKNSKTPADLQAGDPGRAAHCSHITLKDSRRCIRPYPRTRVI